MKSKIIAAIALCGTAISPIMTTAAFATATAVPTAVPADATTLADMASQCDALAAAHEPLDYSATVVPGTITLVSGPTEVQPLDRDNIDNIVGTGSYTWGGIQFVGDPFRNGGSVNMFGSLRATEQNFASSTYDYTASFDSTFAHAFDCAMTEVVHHPAVAANGHYELDTDQSAPAQDNCSNKDDDVNNANYGFHWGNCKFVGTPPQAAYDDSPASRPSEPGVPVEQDQTDTLAGHEANGGPVTLEADPGDYLFVGNPVVCISPKKLPGIWTTQNGYTGDKCTTAWFNDPNIARNGSTTSQGTYKSVPLF